MPKKILLVDDDSKILLLEKTILTQSGFSVETASNGLEALEKLKKGSFDGIVLDILMPHMNGYETAKEIKKLENHKGTPIVMVTAALERDAMSQSFASGVLVFMNKPFTAQAFLSVIQTVVTK
ncbi:MAG TPA: response regulator [Candidatus Hodarchaeales archaeon]|nr:response regulator [Candidatus Hodarchaeales archaeon]